MTAVPKVQSVPVAKQQYYNGEFPYVLEQQVPCGASEAVAWVHSNRTEILSRVDRHGAVLMRNFGLKTDADFDALVRAFELDGFTYAESLSNAVRVNRTERVFTANEAPPDVGIYLHHEMAQTPTYPSRLLFFCEKPAETDGQTPLCRSDIVLNALRDQRPKFVEACQKLGVKYTNVMPAEDDPESGQGRSWRSTLGVDTRQQAEARLSHLGYSWEWLADDILAATTPVLPAVRTLKDGREVFFNQLIAAFRGWADSRNDPSKSIRFGDDSAIDSSDMNVAVRLSDELSFDLNWQVGDVVVVDNFSVMHGRRPFSGTRKVLASLIANDESRWQ